MSKVLPTLIAATFLPFCSLFGAAASVAVIALPGISHAVEKPEVFVQLGHSHTVTFVTFSPDGRYLLSGSMDNTLKLWEASTGREIRTLKGHAGTVTSAGFSPNNKHIISGSHDKTLKLWEVASGRELKTFRGHSNNINTVTFSPDGRYVLSGSADKTMKLWDAASGREVRTFQGHSDSVTCVVFSRDGRYALSGSWDTTVKLWNVASGREVRTFRGHSEWVSSIALSSDGRLALSGGWDDSVILWDVSTGGKLRSLDVRKNSMIKSVGFSPDDKCILSGGGNSKDGIVLWETSTGRRMKDVKPKLFLGQVNSAAFSPDGRFISSASFSTDIRLWDVSTGEEVRQFHGNLSNVRSVAYSPSGKYALSLTDSNHNTIRLWDLSEGKEGRSFGRLPGVDLCIAFSPNGLFAVSGGIDPYPLKLLDVSTGKIIKEFKGHSRSVSSVAFSPDSRYVLSGSADETMKLWDAASGVEVATFRHSGSVTSVAFSPDGRYALSGGSDNTVRVWEVSTGKEVWKSENRFTVYSVAFSPDGRYALESNPLKIRDAASGRDVSTFEGRAAGLVRSIAFSPDGRYVLGGGDGTLKLWEASTGKELRTFAGHSRWITSVAFSPDGRHIMSGSETGATKIWDAATGREICTVAEFKDGEWVIMTPGGFFNSSPDGAQHVNIRFGDKVYGIDQFYAKFYRPELIKLALAGKDIPQGESLGDILAKNPAPTVQIASPVSGSNVDEGSITVLLQVSDNGGGIGNINIYLNGSQVANESRALIVKGKKSAHEKRLSFAIPLIEGRNEIRAVAFNKENSMESNPAIVSVTSRTVLRKPNLYALVVGINEYKNKSITLSYAVSDARAFAESLKKAAAPLFEKTDVQILTSPAATSKEAVANAFEKLRTKIKPNDLFVFFNASHGVVDVVDGEEQYFLITSNVLFLSSRHVGKDAMSQKELARLVGAIPAQKKLVILDTCNAGKGGKGIQVALLQQTRGLTESTAVKLLQRAIGSAVFSASSDTQQAFEGYKGHGLFTYVLMEGLQGKADIKKDGYITVLGLADYVEGEVARISEEVFKRQQTPTIQTGANFPIGKVRYNR